MKRETFHAGSNRFDNLLHVETDGAIVNLQVGLRMNDGHEITRVDVSPDDETRSPDLDGRYWRAIGPATDSRIIRQCDKEECEVCGGKAGQPAEAMQARIKAAADTLGDVYSERIGQLTADQQYAISTVRHLLLED